MIPSEKQSMRGGTEMGDRKLFQVRAGSSRVWLGALLGAVLLLGACGGGSDPEPRSFGADANKCASEHDTETLDLAFNGVKATYKRGGVVNVFARVDRQDTQMVTDLNADLLPGGVEGAEVTLALASKDRDLVGTGITGASGVTNIKIRIPRAMKRGSLDATGFAKKQIADGPCHLQIAEIGKFQRARFLKIK